MKYLFILPSLTVGGSTTSFIALYQQIREDPNLDIRAIALSHDDYKDFPYKEILLPEQHVITAAYLKLSQAHGYWKWHSIIIRLLNRVSSFLHTGFKEWCYKKIVRKIERKNSFDCIIGFQEGMSCQIASYFSNPNKIAWIHCDYQNIYSDQDSTSLLMYSAFRKVVCVSKYTAYTFSLLFPTLKDRIVTIYNLLDGDRVSELSALDTADEKFKSNEGSFIIVSAGRLVPLKRFSEIPRIVSDLHKKGCKVKWYILGPSNDSSEEKCLVDNIARYNVEDDVIWLGKKSNPYPYFKASNLLVCLSTSEACPMIFNEAKILHLPIISTNFGSATEFINEGENGIICPIEDIADTIAKVYRDKDLYGRLVRSEYDFRSYNNTILNNVKNLLVSR